jgi:hypothetical protein
MSKTTHRQVTLVGFLTAVCMVVGWSAPVSAYEYLNPQQCPSGSKWASTPVNYEINNAGSADVSFSQLETIMQDSFAEWGGPGCSSFSAAYQGTTSQTAYGTRGSTTADPIMSWIEQSSNWPSSLGNPSQVLGVTLATFNNNCTINNAPIVFNGISYQYRPAGNVDLESIAVHEIGHLLGLGHTQKQGATMYPSYLGGTQQATIETDDVNGVCSLYGQPVSCTQDSDCRSGFVCNSQGSCEEAPCMSDSECPIGDSCSAQSGDCEDTTCTQASDCPRGFECGSGGTCERICNLCKSCNTASDCGSQEDGWFCQSGLCIKACESFLTCPGDTKCETITFRTQDGTQEVDLCLNPGACTTDPRTWCPDSYACGVGNTDGLACPPEGGEDTGVGQDTGTDTGVVDPDVSTSEDTGTIAPDTGQPEPDTCSGQDCQPADTGPKLDPKLNATGPSNACACGASPGGVPFGALSLAILGLAGMFIHRSRK